MFGRQSFSRIEGSETEGKNDRWSSVAPSLPRTNTGELEDLVHSKVDRPLLRFLEIPFPF